MKATVSVRFTPNENAIDQLTIGTIGVNSSFAGNVYIDNIKLAQYDESGNYVKITENVGDSGKIRKWFYIGQILLSCYL